MTPSPRIPNCWPHLLLGAIALMVIVAAANVRLAMIAGIAAGAVGFVPMRYSRLLAIALIAAVGCVSLTLPGR